MTKNEALTKIRDLEIYIQSFDREYPVSPHQVIDHSKIEVGLVVYYVHKFRSRSTGFIYKYVTLSKAYNSRGIGLFAKTMNLDKDSNFKSSISLNDCGVIPNKYNHHRLFTNRAAAEEYLNSGEYNPEYKGD